MGEIAEMMLDGTLCQCCGVYLDMDDPNGYPTHCEDCADEALPKMTLGKSFKKRMRRVIGENFTLTRGLDTHDSCGITLWQFFLKSPHMPILLENKFDNKIDSIIIREFKIWAIWNELIKK
jgi:hypothetical protein